MSEPSINSVSMSVDESPRDAENPLRRPWQVFRAWLLCTQQRRMIFPGCKTQGRPSARIDPPADAEMVSLRSTDGTPLRAIHGPATTCDPATAPHLLFFYGNEMSLRTSLAVFDALRRCGANVTIPEFIGYGMSGGVASESNCYATADVAVDWLKREKRVDPKKLIVSGASLGGAVAIDLAARAPVAGVITIVTFTSIADVASHHWPGWPVEKFLKHPFRSEEKIRRVTCPLLIIHSCDDAMIPHRHADRLAAAAGGPATRVDVGGEHDCIELMKSSGEAMTQSIRDFLGRLAG